MNLKRLRSESYDRENWTKLRPFYCRLSPEILWAEVRKQLVEELNEELQANASKQWEYATYFTYPTGEQMESIHEGSLFFSEIREIVGYRSAEALALLAGLIRLEEDGDVRVLLEESFANLWQKFAEHGYGHGYDTANTREDLVLMLASNNVFDLVQDHRWIDAMRDYFLTDTHPWSGKPLRNLMPGVMRVFGERPQGLTATDDPAATGVFDLASSAHNLQTLADWLFWEQGRPEDFRSAEPRSIFYKLPYHLVRFTGGERLSDTAVHDPNPFVRASAHFLATLSLRSRIAAEFGTQRAFTLAVAAGVCGDDRYAALMTLGQMIKTGLVVFDTGLQWFGDGQQYRCTSQAVAIV
jgi:hypothetical protein